MLRRIVIVCLGVLATAGASRAAAAQPGGVVVFAAASLKNALDAVNAKWHVETAKPVAVISYAASSTLAKQIDNGAPADLFISADREWMDYVQQRGLIQPHSRVDLLGNRLVLIAPVNSLLGRTVHVTLAAGFPLAILLGRSGRLAMADPAAVPAGIYGKAALTNLGVWSSVAGRIAAAENVRAALALVARGEAPLGIVYQTDATAEGAVKIVATFPPGNTPIVYPMALTKTAKPAAAMFEKFLRGPAASAEFEAQGFTMPDASRTP